MTDINDMSDDSPWMAASWNACATSSADMVLCHWMNGTGLGKGQSIKRLQREELGGGAVRFCACVLLVLVNDTPFFFFVCFFGCSTSDRCCHKGFIEPWGQSTMQTLDIPEKKGKLDREHAASQWSWTVHTTLCCDSRKIVMKKNQWGRWLSHPDISVLGFAKLVLVD